MNKQQIQQVINQVGEASGSHRLWILKRSFSLWMIQSTSFDDEDDTTPHMRNRNPGKGPKMMSYEYAPTWWSNESRWLSLNDHH